jgi:hypothetical protein
MIPPTASYHCLTTVILPLKPEISHYTSGLFQPKKRDSRVKEKPLLHVNLNHILMQVLQNSKQVIVVISAKA